MSRQPAAIASAVGGTVGGLAFFLVLLDFGTDLTRRAHVLGFASNFFDLQARAFLEGRLDVPAGSLGIEGFVIDGRTYTYFPPFPALARLPIFLVTNRFDGRLSLIMMALAFVLYAVFAAKLVWIIRTCVTDEPLTGAQAVAGALLIAVVTGGTVLTFDAALPWVYHEVYLWSAAFVIGGLYWLLRTLLDPSRRHLGWLAAFTAAAILTRTTGGFAIAITVVGVGLLMVLRRAFGGTTGQGRAMIAAGAVPILVSAGYNWAKFRHPYLFPLESQVWTRVNEHRRIALEANGGTITGPQFLPTTIVNYLRPDGIRFTPYFPWLSLPAEPAKAVGGAVVDQSYRTGGVPAFNPLLFTLSVLALGFVGRHLGRPRVRALVPLLVAATGVAGGIMMYGYLTMRYTTEFVPVLVVGGSIGFWWVLPRLLDRRPLVRGLALGATALLVAFSITAHVLVGMTATAFTTRGAALRDYVTTQVRLNGGPDGAIATRTTRVEGAPSGGSTDDYAIQGNCDALYLNTGDQYDPWILVEQRNVAIELRAGDDVKEGEVTLFEIRSDQTRRVVMEIDEEHNALIFIRGRDGDALGSYLPVHANSVIRVGVGADSATGMADVSATPGGHVARVPLAHWNADWVTEQGSIVVPPRAAANARDLGLTLRPATTPRLGLCGRLADTLP